jgi:hypothetical protein
MVVSTRCWPRRVHAVATPAIVAVQGLRLAEINEPPHVNGQRVDLRLNARRDESKDLTGGDVSSLERPLWAVRDIVRAVPDIVRKQPHFEYQSPPLGDV